MSKSFGEGGDPEVFPGGKLVPGTNIIIHTFPVLDRVNF